MAHPRSRGEHGGCVRVLGACRGSSPLARGTPKSAPVAEMVFGLIPARAGNTFQVSMKAARRRAHPRSRGEHMLGASRKATAEGSSPLARGTRSDDPERPGFHGLIPARAGNTHRATLLRSPIRAHPRSRGEHMAGITSRRCSLGSSPLARGTQTVLRLIPYSAGLIPARAGNTGTQQ